MSGTRIVLIAAVVLTLAVGALLFAISGPYGPFMLAVYALAVFLIGGLAALVVMSIRMLHLPKR